MNWLNRAEARLGFLGIPGLPRIVVGFNALCYAGGLVFPGFWRWLELDGALIRQGQVWRVVTFLFLPRWGGLLPGWLEVLFYLMFLYFIGEGVERAMGAFRLTLYYLLGMIGLTLAAVFFDSGGAFANGLLNLSLLFAFVRYYPDTVIMFMLILPLRITWVAWLSAAGLLLNFVFGAWEFRLSVLAGLANYLLFFGQEMFEAMAHRQRHSARKDDFDRQIRASTSTPLHECAICHRSETTPDLEFRVARDGEEYCLEHLPRVAG